MKRIITISLIIVSILCAVGFLILNKNKSPAKSPTPQETQQPQNTTQNSFDKTKYSTSDPTSIWVVVNKKNGIPESFIPELVVPDVKLRLSPNEEQMQINKPTATAIKELFDGAEKEGVTLVFGSGYRSGVLQKQFYDSYKAKDGQKGADTYSARPGHSEHQTGFSADLDSVGNKCHLEICWEDTIEGKWIKDNAYKYGFIIRYPKGKQSITGYQYEPWHIRYVGKELSQELHKTNKTLEEFFDMPPAPDYN